MDSLPSSLPIAKLDAKHDDYNLYGAAWDDLDLLYKGGQALRKQAERFLTKRPKELSEVYASRVQRFTYQDILGSGLGWYQSAMFADNPDIETGGEDNPEDFYTGFLANCDRSGKGYVTFFYDALLKALLFRTAYILEDLPKPVEDQPRPTTLAQQKESGALDPYLVLYDPRTVFNWQEDDAGNLQWIVFATTQQQRSLAGGTKTIDRWYYFDTEQYGVYEAERKDNGDKPKDARLTSSGPHALAEAGRVPVRRVTVPDGLWIANRVYLHALAHLNMQNAYFWALFTGCLAMLWVKGGFQTPPTMAETAYLEIAADGDIGYVEPSGTTYKITSEELSTLREEMYRQMYLQAQGKSSSASASASSGYSKEMDMAPSKDILNALGDILRAVMKLVLQDVAEIRGEDREFDVRGFSFDDTDEAAEVATAQLVDDLDIQSDTLQREVHKRIARTMLKDARPDLVEKIENEIDTSPSKSEREAAAIDQQQQRIKDSLGNATAKYEGRIATKGL